MDDHLDATEYLRQFPQWRQELEAMEARAVYDAREAGLSWAQIGEALGVTQQAAHKRYAQPVRRLMEPYGES